MNSLWKFLTSLRLTVVFLALGILLVFFGTVAQVNEGLYSAQNRWFRSFVVWFQPQGASWKIPMFPGGYFIGIVLLVNLVAAHIKRFHLTWKKLGIHLAHAGIVLLLVGQLATDLLSYETQMRFAEGESKTYSESSLDNELVFLADADANNDDVVAVPESIVARKGEIKHPKLPFTVRVKEYYVNCDVRQRAPMVDKGEPPATLGVGPKITVTPAPEVKTMNARNLPGTLLEVVTDKGSLGTLFTATMMKDQDITIGDKTWRVAFRPTRVYHPFSVQLLKTTHEVYRGTDIPKNFQSRVRIENAQTTENREVDIYMNNPLRYGGLTFYQYQMGREEIDPDRGNSTLQVVRNPSWLTPYAGCAIVALGLIVQFMMHLVGFISKRKTA